MNLLTITVGRGFERLRLRQRTIQVDIAPVDKNMLTRHVACSRRKQKDDTRGNFLWCGHALLKGNLRDDAVQLFFRIRKSAQPLTVQRCHDFGWYNRIYANSIVKQLGSPLAS